MKATRLSLCVFLCGLLLLLWACGESPTATPEPAAPTAPQEVVEPTEEPAAPLPEVDPTKEPEELVPEIEPTKEPEEVPIVEPTKEPEEEPIVEPPAEAEAWITLPGLSAPQMATFQGQLESGIPFGVLESGNPFKGDPSAPVVIVEFSDYQCPYCANYVQQTLPQISESYIATGQVVYVYVNMPLSFHEQAQAAAEAAECAGLQRAFWPMHDLLFDSQAEWSGSPEAELLFREYAAQLGLDEATFAACMEEHWTAAQIEQDLSLAENAGVSATPTFFINGEPLVGAMPYESFQEAIEGAGARPR